MNLFNIKIKKSVVSTLSAVSVLFSFLFVFLGSAEGYLYKLALSATDTKSVVFLWTTVGTAAFVAILALTAGILQLFDKKVKTIYLLNVIISIVSLIFSILIGNLKIAYPIINLIVNIVTFVYVTIYEVKNKGDKEEEQKAKNTSGMIFSIIISFISMAVLFSIFLIPICYYDNTAYYSLMSGMQNISSNEQFIFSLASYFSFFTLYCFLLLYFTQSLAYSKNLNKLLTKTRTLLFLEFDLAIVYFFYTIITSYFERNSQIFSVSTINLISYIPFVVIGVLAVINSIVSSRYITLSEEELEKEPGLKLKNRVVALVFTILFLGLLVGSLFCNILVITYTYSSTSEVITVNGLNVLQNYHSMDASYKILAFFIYIMLVFAIVAFVLSITLFFRKSKYFFKFSFGAVCASFVLILVLSFFSKYYEVMNGIQSSTIEKILEANGMNVSVDYETKITTQTLYFAIAALALVVCLIAFRPFTNKVKEDALDVNINNDLTSLKANSSDDEKSSEPDKHENGFDPCPAFTEIDAGEKMYLDDIKERKEYLFNKPSLPNVVRFVVEYARDSRLHLSYTEEDIAQFVAGLGSSRLSILQGMSGTGKTSLPKIFTEALFGNCNIIEVESSWKDKNELIGYYNEFSAKFTPKKFTQALYRAKFTPEVITFIVLDEMNLSRIEYYFSDFLSLMENEEDKREIKLLNVQLKYEADGELKEYKQLDNGHTIKIPTNVWFIGTANRDESTFEISDKVYDRAMTMNFTTRAPKVKYYDDPLDKRFLTYTDFSNLIAMAKNNYKFDCESSEIVKEVERLLAQFNISFGNRILNQIESFVSVYCSCFNDPKQRENEALEKILLTKVVQKLETKSVENKEELVHAFEKIGLLKCAEFISKLNEDF